MDAFEYDQVRIEIQPYKGTADDDLRLLAWYQELLASGDLPLVLWEELHPIGAFMGVWRSSDRALFYALDDRGHIWMASWFEPILNRVAFMSLWIRRDARCTKTAAVYARHLYTEAFKHLSVILGLTKQERLLRMHERSGYRIMSKLPLGWGGKEDAWLMELTEERFTMAREPRSEQRNAHG